MKNIEIVNNLNALNAFVSKEKECSPFLTIGAAFKVRKNIKTLMENYKVYEETLNTVDKQDAEKLKELLEIDNEIDLEMIKENDFVGSCGISDIMLLDFMIDDEN